MAEPSQELVLPSTFRRALALASTMAEITELRARAEAVRRYAKTARRSLHLQNEAAEARLRAERKAGAMLAGLKLHGGRRDSRSRTTILKLESLGVTRDQSARWQREAGVPEELFAAYLLATREAGQEITGSGLLRSAVDRRKLRRHGTNPTPGVAPPPDERTAASDCSPEPLAELANHCALLASLLLPYCDGSQLALGMPERRHAAYLLREMENCIAALKPPPPPGSPRAAIAADTGTREFAEACKDLTR